MARSACRPGTVLVLAAAILGCSSDCVILPCLQPTALTVTVKTAAGDPVADASLQISGVITGSQPCPGSCQVSGTAGDYHLIISAPGYQSVERTVRVTGAAPRNCSCERVNTESVAITLS